MLPIARVGDTHACPIHGSNAIIEGGTGTIDGRAIARMGDKCACGGTIIEGSSASSCDGKPVAFLGAKTTCGGTITQGAKNGTTSK